MAIIQLLKQRLPAQIRKMWCVGFRYRIADAIFQLGQLMVAIWVLLALQNTQDASMPWVAFAILISLLIFRLYIVSKAIKRLTPAAYQLGVNIRRHLLFHLVSLPLSTLHQLKAGNIARTLSEDIQWIENQAAYTTAQIACQLLLFMTLYLVIFSVDWRVALSALSILLIGLFLFLLLKRKLHRMLQVRSNKLADATSLLIEYAQGIAFIRASGMNTTVQQRFEHQIEQMRQGFRRGVIAATPLVGLLYIIIDSSVAIGVITCAYQFNIENDNAIPQAIIVLLLLFSTIIPLRGAIGLLNLSTLAKIGEYNVRQIEMQHQQNSGSRTEPMHQYDVRVENIDYRYPGTTQYALNDISFYAPEGSVTAIVGPSGSGKSTLMHLLLAYYSPDKGNIYYGGTALSEYQTQAFYDCVTMVFQETYLFQDTIANNLRVAAPNASQLELESVTQAVNLHETILSLPLGYETILGVEGGTLSGGERQRLAIARALLKSSPIIFLDEATASLDPENENVVQQAIKTLSRHKTVFIIAHRLKTIVQADQILVLDQGRLIDCADHNTLLSRCSLYKNLWDHQYKAQQWHL